MNLVSYEYIATQRERHGVMILSEFTGAAQSLNGSLIVNPWNTDELAGAIHDAVTMSPEAREMNFKKLEKYVFKYTSAWWGESFVSELVRISEIAQKKQKALEDSLASKKGDKAKPKADGVDGDESHKGETWIKPGEWRD